VRVIDARWGEAMEIAAGDRTTPFTGWANYIAVVVRRFMHNFPGAELGVDLAIASDLPRAAGLSSSSALVVGVASALIRRAGLASRDDFRAGIENTLDLAGYLGAVENGLNFKSLTSVEGVGTHGGSEDHTAILTCRPHRLSAYAYVPVRHIDDVEMPAEWRFVIASSGVHADKAGGARDRYNRASLLTRALLEIWNAADSSSAPTLGAALAENPEHIERLRRLAAASTRADYRPEDLTKRLAHFVGEDGRIRIALDAFRRADAATLGTLASGTQRDADELLENQVDETRTLAALARDLGAIGASSFGAGFGGSVWAVTRAADAEPFGAAWVQAYQRACPDVKNVEWFVTRPSASVTELNLES
jgi:galactokinase